MFKNMKFALKIFYVALVLIFSTCKQEVLNSDKVGKPFSQLSSTRILNDSLIDLSAQFHNDFLDSAMNQIDWNYSPLSTSKHAVFMSFYDSAYGGININEYEDIISEVLENEVQISPYLFNPVDFLNIFDKIEMVINDSNNNFEEIEDSLSNLEIYANSNLYGSDLDAALLMIRTSLKSAHFWLPVARGGSGIGQDYIEENELPQISVIGKACAIDGLGASFGFLMIGFLVAPTPVTLFGIAAYVGLRAAEASVAYLISAID